MKQIIAFGDSNTWGLDPVTKTRFPESVRWTGILRKELLPASLHLAEEGLCGRTTVYDDPDRPGLKGLEAVPGLLANYPEASAAIIMLGTNDCKAVFHASAEDIGAGLERCLDLFEKRIRPGNILILSPVSLGEDVWKPDKDPAFDARSVAVCARLKTVYAEIAARRGSLFLAASDIASVSGADGEHLDAAGHRKLAEAILKRTEALNP